jgi:hypothetical protein
MVRLNLLYYDFVYSNRDFPEIRNETGPIFEFAFRTKMQYR